MAFIFVTVGTTKFDELVRAVDSHEFVEWARTHGFENILIQRGSGTFTPTSEIIRFYEFKPSLTEDMAKAGLVVSHAGSGSLIEALELGKKTVVVVNTALMHNHQLELATKLSQLGLVDVAHGPTELMTAVNASFSRHHSNSSSGQPRHNLAHVLEEDVSLVRHERNIRMMAVMGSGGHTTEMARAVNGLDFGRYRPRTYVVAETDSISPHKVAAIEQAHSGTGAGTGTHFVRTIPRSREVGQSWLTTIWTTLIAFLFSLRLVWRERPDVILCNGPGTCVPICIAARIVRLLQWREMKVVFIESIARVTSLSLSAQILRHFVDVFVVQWPELKHRFPRSLLRNFFFSL